MKRFIRYLYEYEQGKRTRNVGFVKVECDYEVCTVHVHGRGLRLGNNRKLALYLFYEEKGQCIGIWQGDTENVNPAVNYRLRFTPEDTKSPENFNKIKGVILEGVDGEKYAAVWDDMPVNVNQMKIWEKEPAKESPIVEAELEETQTKEIQAEGIQSEKKELKKNMKVTKIQRKELVKLPRCEWKLSNNSFLLHGYYNYHHLVLIEQDDLWRLGVPGIYHENENKAAAAFGFFEFISIKELQVSLEEEENDENEQFGYWCRQIRMYSY